MVRVRSQDRKRYVLSDELDLVILEKIYNLEKCKLSPADIQVINLIRTQLKKEWRKPLIKFLDGLGKKYNK